MDARASGHSAPARDRRYRAPDRDTILNVAAQLFERRGYRSTTMQDLADELNISKATLYAHGKSKTDVLIGIFEQWTQLTEQDLDQAVRHPQPVERVRLLLRLWIQRSVSMRAHRTVFALCASDHELAPDVAARFIAWDDSIQERLRELVALAQELGVVRTEINANVAALQLINAPRWAADRLVAPGLLDVDATVEQVLDLLLYGLFKLDAPTQVAPPSDDAASS
jgi:TetR/AcrR family transcriptional regulator, cholesterol catabolism regulator